MSRQSRRDRNNRKKIIMRRRIILALFLLILIPILYKGTSFLIKGSKSLYSTVSSKEDRRDNSEEKLADKEKPIDPKIGRAHV